MHGDIRHSTGANVKLFAAPSAKKITFNMNSLENLLLIAEFQEEGDLSMMPSVLLLAWIPNVLEHSNTIDEPKILLYSIIYLADSHTCYTIFTIT